MNIHYRPQFQQITYIQQIINHNMFKNIQIADDFNEVKHDCIPENIFRKTIQG